MAIIGSGKTPVKDTRRDQNALWHYLARARFQRNEGAAAVPAP